MPIPKRHERLRMKAAPGVYVSPCHWLVGQHSVTLIDPAQLHLDEATAQSCFDYVRPLWQDSGLPLAWHSPLLWPVQSAASGQPLPKLAPLTECIGLAVEQHLPTDARLRRLLTESQMWLYAWPQNDERQAQGLPSINALWLHCVSAHRPTLWQRLTRYIPK